MPTREAGRAAAEADLKAGLYKRLRYFASPRPVIAVLLLAAHSRPFSGEISVSPALLLQVMPEAPGSRAPPK